jgi:shikimate kinase
VVGAVDKHLALIGFMGAGKTMLGRELAQLTNRPFVDTDEEIEKRFGPIDELFERGEQSSAASRSRSSRKRSPARQRSSLSAAAPCCRRRHGSV